MELTDLELRYNIAAFTVAILNEGYTVEDSFNALEEDLKSFKIWEKELNNEEIYNLRQMGVRNIDVARVFGISKSNVCHRVKRHKEKLKQEEMLKCRA